MRMTSERAVDVASGAIVAAFAFQRRLKSGKWRASHSDLDSGQTSLDVVVESAAGLGRLARVAAAPESVMVASSTGLRHEDWPGVIWPIGVRWVWRR